MYVSMSSLVAPAAAGRSSVDQASHDDEMVRSRFRAGLLSSSFTVAPAAGAGKSSSLIVLDPSASLLIASSHRPIDSVRSQPSGFCLLQVIV